MGDIQTLRDYLIKQQTVLHSNILLEGLKTLWEQNELIDVVIHVNNHKFRAHKVVLSACSDYFKAMFSKNMRESQLNSVTLYDMSQVGFNLLLNYMYTSKLELTEENVQDVLEVAVYCQVQHVINKCAEYLETHLNKNNCVDMVRIAETFALSKLKTATYTYICSNLSEIGEINQLCNFTPEQIENILKLDLPVNCYEADVLYFVFKWIFCSHTEIPDKLQRIPNILKLINYEQIPRHTVAELLENASTRFGNQVQTISLYKAVSEEIESIPLFGPNISRYAFNQRGMAMALVKIGGFDKSGVTNEINFCFYNEKHWNYLTKIPHVEQSNFGTAVLNNSLYVIGGCFNQLLQEIIHPYGFKYNPKEDVWTNMAPMKTGRCRFTLNTCDGRLYAIGGVIECENDEEDTNTCECFDPSQESWEFIDPLPDCRSQHAAAAVTIQGVNKLYVSGGVHRIVMDSLFCFDTVTKTWTVCTSMLTPRADHFMFGYGNKIYVCGGSNRLPRQVDTIDAYDCLSDTWEVVSQVPTPRHHAGVVACGSKIYIVGGFTEDAVFHKDVAPVECYDILTNEWTFDDKNVQEYWEHSCATLYIPKNIRRNHFK